jgi:hypothetical protein
VTAVGSPHPIGFRTPYDGSYHSRAGRMMKPKRAQLQSIIDLKHPLASLARETSSAEEYFRHELFHDVLR